MSPYPVKSDLDHAPLMKGVGCPQRHCAAPFDDELGELGRWCRCDPDDPSPKVCEICYRLRSEYAEPACGHTAISWPARSGGRRTGGASRGSQATGAALSSGAPRRQAGKYRRPHRGGVGRRCARWGDPVSPDLCFESSTLARIRRRSEGRAGDVPSRHSIDRDRHPRVSGGGRGSVHPRESSRTQRHTRHRSRPLAWSFPGRR